MRVLVNHEKKNLSPDHNAIVAKDNAAISQLAKLDLSSLRLLAFCLAHYNSRSGENPRITARVADLSKLFPMEAKSAYAVVKKTLLSLWSRPAEFREGRKTCLRSWISGVDYEDGTFSFYIAPEMEPYLLRLKGAFTQYRLKDVYQFKAASSWKLYENLARWRVNRHWVVELDELRLCLGVAGKYPRWNSLQQRIIAPAVAEINEVSDLTIEYYQEKRGRRVVGLVFQIEQKREDDGTIDLEPPEGELLRRLLEAGINAKAAGKYAREINRQGKADRILARLSGMIERAKQHPGIPKAKYVLGSIQGELSQGNLFEQAPIGRPATEPEHKPALDCWHYHRQQKEPCSIRLAGLIPKEEKCQICLKSLPVDQFGA